MDGVNVLIPFDCIMDIDTGLLKVIKNDYSNDIVFDMSKITDEESMKDLTLHNHYNNPVELIIRDDYKDKVDLFYNQFMESEYENILKNSPFNSIQEFAYKTIISGFGRVTFLVFNNLQNLIVEDIFKGSFETLNLNSLEELDVNRFDDIFLKRYKDGTKIKNLKGKYLYILDYKFNYDEDGKILDPIISMQIGLDNSIRIISPYSERRREENDF